MTLGQCRARRRGVDSLPAGPYARRPVEHPVSRVVTCGSGVGGGGVPASAAVPDAVHQHERRHQAGASQRANMASHSASDFGVKTKFQRRVSAIEADGSAE